MKVETFCSCLFVSAGSHRQYTCLVSTTCSVDISSLIYPSILLSFAFPFPAGSLCAGCGAVPLQWCEHVRVPYFKHREQPSVLHHWKVVHGASASTSQTRLWLIRRLYDGKAEVVMFYCQFFKKKTQKTFFIIWANLLLLCIVFSCICIVKSYSLNGYCSWMVREINWRNSSSLYCIIDAEASDAINGFTVKHSISPRTRMHNLRGCAEFWTSCDKQGLCLNDLNAVW